jgi:hypothetical protein
MKSFLTSAGVRGRVSELKRHPLSEHGRQVARIASCQVQVDGRDGRA